MSRAAAAAVAAFLVLPLVALFVEAPLTDLPGLLGTDAVQDAIRVTALTNLAANALVLGLGTPAAWFLATRRFRGRALVVTVCELPLVLPPAVAGIALLSALGPQGVLGGPLDDAGIVLPFGPGAVVLAVAFVAAPFYLRGAIAAFEAVPHDMLDVARTLGASRARTFWRVALPLALQGLLAGWVLAFARGIGEFGATIVFAGSVGGRTQTLPLEVYLQLDADLDVALALGVLLVLVSAGVLLSYKLLGAWNPSSSTSRTSFAASASSSP